MAQRSKFFKKPQSVWTPLSICTAIFLAMPFHESQAKVLSIDNDDVTIFAINIRTIWTPDKDYREQSLKGLENKQFSYNYKLNGMKGFSNGGFNYSRTENELTPIIEDSLRAKGQTNSRTGAFFGVGLVNDEISINPSDMQKFINAEEALYKLSIVRQGNPDTAETRFSNKKLLGNLLGLVTLGIGMNTLGVAGGFNTFAGTGLSQNIASLPVGINQQAVTGAHGFPSDIDWNVFKHVDLFPGGSQVIIAYKKEKTEEIHNQSMARAINKMLDISPEELKQYWAEDFAYRQKIWEECKATGDKICQE